MCGLAYGVIFRRLPRNSNRMAPTKLMAPQKRKGIVALPV